MKRPLQNIPLIGMIAAGIAVGAWIILHRISVSSLEMSGDCLPAYSRYLMEETRNEEEDPEFFQAFAELPLRAMPECIDEIYRMNWIPESHSPIVVRVWKSGAKYLIVAKRLKSRGWSEYKNLDVEQTRPLSESEWDHLRNLIDKTSYWTLTPTVAESSTVKAVWLVEGRKGSQYHWVRRTQPAGSYAEVCKYLIRLAGIETYYDLYVQP